MTLSCVIWGMDGGGGRSCCSPLGWNHPNRGIPCGIKAGEGLMEGWEPAAGRERAQLEESTEKPDATLAAIPPVY